jgi:hypothetical protein
LANRSLRHGESALLLRRRRFVGLPAAIGDQDAEALTVVGDRPLSGAGGVLVEAAARTGRRVSTSTSTVP